MTCRGMRALRRGEGGVEEAGWAREGGIDSCLGTCAAMNDSNWGQPGGHAEAGNAISHQRTSCDGIGEARGLTSNSPPTRHNYDSEPYACHSTIYLAGWLENMSVFRNILKDIHSSCRPVYHVSAY